MPAVPAAGKERPQVLAQAALLAAKYFQLMEQVGRPMGAAEQVSSAAGGSAEAALHVLL
jgi:hypothetical protein